MNDRHLNRHAEDRPEAYDQMFAIRYRNPGDPKYAIIRIVKPNGGLFTVIPETTLHQVADENIAFREVVFDRLVLMDDVFVSPREYERLQAFALQMMQIDFTRYASTACEILLMDQDFETGAGA
jgi:hypothetical protein